MLDWLQNWLGKKSTPRQARALPHECVQFGFEAQNAGALEQAFTWYEAALQQDPSDRDALYFSSRLCAQLQRFERQLEILRQATLLHPGEAVFWFDLGQLLYELRRFESALQAYQRCLQILPECRLASNNTAVILGQLSRNLQALEILDRLLHGQPDDPMALVNQADAYCRIGQADRAIAAMRSALQHWPQRFDIRSSLLFEMNYSSACRSDQLVAAHIEFGERCATPHCTPALEQAGARRLRIGYVSGDFYEHVVMRFIEPLLEQHDRTSFDIFCYRTYNYSDQTSQRLFGYQCSWRDCEALADQQICELIRADRIDILVDLSGHSLRNRLPVFARQPCAIQMSYLGYPNTTGLTEIKYRLTDQWADPLDAGDHPQYEQLLRLPRSYFCYRPEAGAPAVGALPAESAGVVTFGCFNNFSKLSDDFVTVAAEVLAAVPGSRLYIKAAPLSETKFADAVRTRFAALGVSSDRLQLVGWLATNHAHLESYQQIDIALDSFPYNGATTTCEALYMGVPVVTLRGDRHAGRMGCSLLNAVGLSELIAADRHEFVRICKNLAADLGRLGALRNNLRARVEASALMDEPGFVAAVEQVFRGLFQEYWRQRNDDPGPDPDQARDQASALLAAGRPAAAVRLLDRLTDRPAAAAGALESLWQIALDSGHAALALAPLQRALAGDPDNARLRYMLGEVHCARRDWSPAAAEFRHALSEGTQDPKVFCRLGDVLLALDDPASALPQYQRAQQVDPVAAAAYLGAGRAQLMLGRFREARDAVECAVAIEPEDESGWRVLANLAWQVGDWELARRATSRLLELAPTDSAALRAIASLDLRQGYAEAALARFTRALRLQPADPGVHSLCILAQSRCPDTTLIELEGECNRWFQAHAQAQLRSTALECRSLGGAPLRIGFLLPPLDSRQQAVQLAAVLSLQEAAAVVVYGYSLQPIDQVDERMVRSLNGLRSVAGRSDREILDQIRADGVDVFVDLIGHGLGGCKLLSALQAAAVQIDWSGLPASYSASANDFVLSDVVMHGEVAGDEDLRGGQLCLQRSLFHLAIEGDAAVAHSHAVVEDAGGRFGSLQDLWEITDADLELWARVLRRVPRSLFEFHAHELASNPRRDGILKFFMAHGVAAERLIFKDAAHCKWVRAEQAATIDVLLDSCTFSGAESALAGLRVGIPTVCMLGTDRRSRAVASVATAAGLAELIAAGRDEYCALAASLLSDGTARKLRRADLLQKVANSPLCDVAGLKRDLVTAIRRACSFAMAQHQEASGNPDSGVAG